MLEFLKETGENLIATKVSGKIDADDMDKLLPVLKSTIEKFEKVSWYYEMEGLQGWTPKGFWQDITFVAQHTNSFKKIAMVGEKDWEKMMTDMMKPFTPAEIKFFETTQKEEAKKWIRS
jgi:hypothetical protein